MFEDMLINIFVNLLGLISECCHSRAAASQ